MTIDRPFTYNIVAITNSYNNFLILVWYLVPITEKYIDQYC